MRSEAPEERLKGLLAEAQAKLVELLMVDIDLAFTFLETAHVTSTAERREELAEKATRALDAIRHFLPRIEDPTIQQNIQQKANELEAAIREVQS